MNNFWKNKKIVVTGANGFIGSHIVNSLSEKGACLTAVVSKKTAKADLRKELTSSLNVTIARANLLTLQDCLRITEDQEIVLNFAALDGGILFKQQHPVDIFETNTCITINMLKAADKMKIKKFLLISSIEVYSKKIKKILREEDGFTGEVSEGYAWSKRLSEIAANMYYRQYHLPIIIARLGNVYGPGDDIRLSKGRVIPQFIVNSILHKDISIVGDGKQERAFLYIDDLVSSLKDLVEHGKIGEVFNIASNQRVSIAYLAKKIIALTGNNNSIIFKNVNINNSKMGNISMKKVKKAINFKEKYALEDGLIKTIDYLKTIYK